MANNTSQLANTATDPARSALSRLEEWIDNDEKHQFHRPGGQRCLFLYRNEFTRAHLHYADRYAQDRCRRAYEALRETKKIWKEWYGEQRIPQQSFMQVLPTAPRIPVRQGPRHRDLSDREYFELVEMRYRRRRIAFWCCMRVRIQEVDAELRRLIAWHQDEGAGPIAVPGV